MQNSFLPICNNWKLKTALHFLDHSRRHRLPLACIMPNNNVSPWQRTYLLPSIRCCSNLNTLRARRRRTPTCPYLHRSVISTSGSDWPCSLVAVLCCADYAIVFTRPRNRRTLLVVPTWINPATLSPAIANTAPTRIWVNVCDVGPNSGRRWV